MQKQTLQRIADIEGLPEIGQFYLVPCAKVIRLGRHHRYKWWPVIGPVHDDKEYLNFPHEHYHYDFRFITDALWNSRYGSRSLKHPSVMGVVQHVKVMQYEVEHESVVEVVEKKLRCIRQMIEFPNQLCYVLEPTFKDATVNLNCLRCPHRGVPLNGLPQDDAGNVICPGHGLKWNLTTGGMISRKSTHNRSMS